MVFIHVSNVVSGMKKILCKVLDKRMKETAGSPSKFRTRLETPQSQIIAPTVEVPTVDEEDSMAVKVVTITADKGGTVARQEAQLKKAKASLQTLVIKASRTISVNTKEDESKFQFIAVVELPDEPKEEKREDRGIKSASKKEK